VNTNSLLTINGTAVTEHGRKISLTEEISANDIELASGLRRRFYSTNKKQFSVTWSYLPDLQSKTLDAKPGRNFLLALANTSAVALVSIALEPGQTPVEYSCYLDSYSESLLRKDLSTKCSYYDVSLTLTEQ
jgi:hypothetical protein